MMSKLEPGRQVADQLKKWVTIQHFCPAESPIRDDLEALPQRRLITAALPAVTIPAEAGIHCHRAVGFDIGAHPQLNWKCGRASCWKMGLFFCFHAVCRFRKSIA